MVERHRAGLAVTLSVRGARAKAPPDNRRAWRRPPSDQRLATVGKCQVAVLQLFVFMD
jgi:hypothetical protein